MEFIIEATETTVIFATGDKAPLLVENASKLTTLKMIVLMTPAAEGFEQKAKDAGLDVVSFTDLEKEGCLFS